MPVDVLTMLPAATLARAVPDAAAAKAAAGSTVHLLDGGRPRCGRRPRRLAPVDLAVPPPLRVCTPCARQLPEMTRLFLATTGTPTLPELAAVHEHTARTIAQACADQLTRLREDAVYDGSASEPVHLVQAAPRQRDGDPVRALTFGGHTATAVPMTLGLLIGALIPGAMTGGRTWITDPPEPGTSVSVPGGTVSAAVALTPRPAGTYPAPTRRRAR